MPSQIYFGENSVFEKTLDSNVQLVKASIEPQIEASAVHGLQSNKIRIEIKERGDYNVTLELRNDKQ